MSIYVLYVWLRDRVLFRRDLNVTIKAEAIRLSLLNGGQIILLAWDDWGITSRTVLTPDESWSVAPEDSFIMADSGRIIGGVVDGLDL